MESNSVTLNFVMTFPSRFHKEFFYSASFLFKSAAPLLISGHVNITLIEPEKGFRFLISLPVQASENKNMFPLFREDSSIGFLFTDKGL